MRPTAGVSTDARARPTIVFWGPAHRHRRGPPCGDSSRSRQMDRLCYRSAASRVACSYCHPSHDPRTTPGGRRTHRPHRRRQRLRNGASSVAAPHSPDRGDNTRARQGIEQIAHHRRAATWLTVGAYDLSHEELGPSEQPSYNFAYCRADHLIGQFIYRLRLPNRIRLKPPSRGARHDGGLEQRT